MPHTVKIRDFAIEILVPDGDSILEAALDEGLDYPFFCKGGTCGQCKSRLFSGRVELRPYAHFALTDAERAAGLILACRAEPESDCDIALGDLPEGPSEPKA